MAVTATISKTLTGTAPADSLTGGASGYSFGQSQTGVTAPNKEFFVKHDGTALIDNVCLNLQAMTGTYGGDYSPNADMTKIATVGDAGYGFQIDFDWDNIAPFGGSFVQFQTGVGVSYATRYVIPATAMSRNNAGTEVAASAGVAGQIGAAADATLGDRAHFFTRFMTATGETQTGKRQFDTYVSFNYTT